MWVIWLLKLRIFILRELNLTYSLIFIVFPHQLYPSINIFNRTTHSILGMTMLWLKMFTFCLKANMRGFFFKIRWEHSFLLRLNSLFEIQGSIPFILVKFRLVTMHIKEKKKILYPTLPILMQLKLTSRDIWRTKNSFTERNILCFSIDKVSAFDKKHIYHLIHIYHFFTYSLWYKW